VNKEVVQLRDDGGRDVGRALAGNRDKSSELAALFDDLFEQLETIVLPCLTLPRRLSGQDVESNRV